MRQDHPHCFHRDLLRIIRQGPFISSVSKSSAPYFFSLCLCSLLLCQKKKRSAKFNADHPRYGSETCRGQLPAVGGSGGLRDGHVCDHSAGAACAFLHPQNSTQPSSHIHLPVRIRKELIIYTFCYEFHKVTVFWYFLSKIPISFIRLWYVCIIAEMSTAATNRVRRQFCSLTLELWP